MTQVDSNGVRLEYETFGDPADPPLVLIMGLGAQLIAWPVAFCEGLAERGFHVVRFDNRDCGLSTFLDDLPAPDLGAIIGGDRATVPYLISDMSADAVGLLDALGFAKAHIVGASMGGMIGQQLAIDHPDRVLSLCSIMSTTGDPDVGQPSPEAAAMLGAPPPATREAAIEQGIKVHKLISSPGYPATDDYFRDNAIAAYDRSHNPAGPLRQLGAIIASPSRTEGLHGLRMPCLVVHGTDDPLVDISGGEATAAAIPGATWLSIAGMGHDMAPGTWPTIIDAIASNTKA
ncbi:MAG TPA: alpha/beta hydrolase [Pseudonocardiaceae bacterium]|jgi:pimeloyl-ACP methyl ester carboxylesterase|nr:alpha/beta hydrolase [Pseudonocardiaceae bacterium]